MELLANPQDYEIYFSIASLVLLAVILLIHLSEEFYYGKQSRIFGVLIVNSILLNCMGLIHKLWLNFDWMKELVSYDLNSLCVMTEKACCYTLAFLSIKYVMAIFHIDSSGSWKNIFILGPFLYALAFCYSGIFMDYFYTFTPEGELKYFYPQGATVNIGIWLYFIFAAYLIIKYTRTISTEKGIALVFYFFLMLGGIPIRILLRSSSIFEFSVSISLLLCVYTFQNPSEFLDRMSGAGTRKALDFAISTNLLQKKKFTLYGIMVDKLSIVVGGEPLEAASDLLGQITGYLRQMCPDENIFYSEEGLYTMLLPGITPDDPTIEKMDEQIRNRFKDSWQLRNLQLKLYESPFAVGFPGEVSSMEKFNEVRGLINKALLKQNRDILRVGDLNLKYVDHDKKIDNIVKHALDDGLLEVYYQPIYSPEVGKFTSCEALLRLKDPQLGFISPAVFMPVAERNGAVLDIDRFVLTSVCKMLSESNAIANDLEYVEVNLSVVDCIQNNMAENILGTLEKYNVEPKRINLEVTETWNKDITVTVDENFQKLMEAGVELSMDDFGTGYSNIVRIANFPVKIFKLDKSIIQSAFESETSYMVMINMIKIIKSLGKEIVAEGVETAEQAKQLAKLGCGHIQGFFYSRPMPQEQFLAFLDEHNH